MTTVPPLLAELVTASAPTGSEDAVAAIVRRELAGFGARIETDVLGGTVGRLPGTPGGRTVGLFAHADEIGAIVTHVEPSGFATISPLGTITPDRLLGHRVEVLGRAGAVPGRVLRAATGDVTWTQLRVDIGASDADEARTLIEPGDPVVLSAQPVALAGGRLMSKALDNRVGVYVVTEVGRRLAAAPPAWEVAVVVNPLEEGPLVGGALTAARVADVELAIVLDVTYAQDVPGAEPAEWGSTSLGGGPTVFRGPPTHPRVVERLRAAAEETGIGYGIEAGKSTWTDADSLHTLGAGLAVGVVGVPIRYMHTASEVVQLTDVDDAIALVEAFVRALPLDVSFLR